MAKPEVEHFIQHFLSSLHNGFSPLQGLAGTVNSPSPVRSPRSADAKTGAEKGSYVLMASLSTRITCHRWCEKPSEI